MSDLYWPGTTIAKSQGNGFTIGLRTSDDCWHSMVAQDAARQRSAEAVEKRRMEGKDISTIHGLKGNAPKYRATKLPKRAGPNKSRMIREMLANGPATSTYLADKLGNTPKMVRALMRHDMKGGTIVRVPGSDPALYALVAPR